MYSADKIRGTLQVVLAGGVARIARRSATAAAFARRPHTLPGCVLVRHAVEHVFRIRMFRPFDARAQQLLEESKSPNAAEWARYARSEAVHDRYFLRDLEAMGVSRPSVEIMRPFAATVQLGAFIRQAIEAYGPLPVVLYSFWAEECSDVGTAPVIDRIRALFGPDAARGASAHRALDENLDHAGVISDILAGMIRTDGDLLAAAGLLDGITERLGAYFDELHVWAGDAAPARLMAAGGWQGLKPAPV